MLASVLSAIAVMAIDRSLVMTADPGYYSGVSEGKYILANMTSQVNISTALPYCAEAVEGYVHGVPMTLITTGIGHDNAAGCTVSVFAYYGAKGVKITDVIYLGTSGWSPMVGGVFNPETDTKCEKKPTNPQPSQLIGVGDVCISPISFLLNCGFCDWPDSSLGECVSPACTQHNESSVFGQCDFFTHDTTLADQLLTASKQIQYPERTDKLNGYLHQYWDATWKGLGVQSDAMPTKTPGIYDYKMCGEAASYNLWKGLPNDFQCRKYLANIVSQLNGVQKTASDVTCVSAMEGPGWMRVLLNKGTQGGKIPFVGLRGASNYDSWPLMRTPTGTLVSNNEWIPSNEQEDFTLEGYHYAIKTTTSIVLQHFYNKATQAY